jgi:hypothetical protein
MFLFSVRPRPAPQAPDFPSHFQRQAVSQSFISVLSIRTQKVEQNQEILS